MTYRYLIIALLLLHFRAAAQEHMVIRTEEYPSQNYISFLKEQQEKIKQTKILVAGANAIIWQYPDSGRAMLYKALTISRSIHYDRGAAIALMALGSAYENIGAYDTTLSYYRLALVYLSRAPVDNELAGRVKNNIAMLYSYVGVYQEAGEYFYKALAKADTGAIRGHLYNNLSIVLSGMGEYDKALMYVRQGKEWVNNHPKEQYILPYLYINEADILIKQEKMDEAALVGMQLYKLAGNAKDIGIRHEANDMLGKIYDYKKIPAKALAYYRQGLAMSTDYPMGAMRSSMSIGMVYMDEKRYDSAEKYLLRALTIARHLGHRQELTHTYNYLAQLSFATHRYEAAYQFLQTSMSLYDSSVNTDKVRFINLMEIKYQTEKKDKELAEKKLTIAQQHAILVRKNTWIWGMATGAVLLCVFFFLFFRNARKLQKKHEEITAWRSMAEGEEKERTRMARELHDGIGGSLSTLKMYLDTIQKKYGALAETRDYNDAQKLLDNTLEEVRQTAHNLMPELLLRHGLPEAVRIFCSNVPATYGLKIDFQYYGFIGRLNTSFELAVYRIIQELVQNVIKHANASFAVVQLSQHGHILSVTVEDNGIGMDSDGVSVTGMGLQSIKRRVTELNGIFSLTSSQGKGTVAYFEFNLQNQKNFVL